MPQAARKDTQAQRAQDKESKRARGALSCAECRRLKLKCDKTVPCASCKRRGCSAICPNGSLITGQGTRFVLADTEKLHHKIAQMSDRIRQLEDGLSIAHASLNGPGAEAHPLLQRNLLKVKSSIELHSASTAAEGGDDTIREQDEDEDPEPDLDAFGTLAIRDDGAATFYGRSAGSESLLIGEASAPSPGSSAPETMAYAVTTTTSVTETQIYEANFTHEQHYAAASEAPLPSSVVNLASSFPLAPSITSTPLLNPNEPVTLQLLTLYYLPPFEEASRLVSLYLEQAPWFFGAVTGKQIEEELMPLWYESAPRSAAASLSTSPTNGVKRTGTSHDLALLFVIFCFGSLTDINLPAAPDNAPAERFYQLTKAALTLDPGAVADAKSSRNGVLERPPSIATVQVLSLMAIYEGLCSGENSIESTWALMGLATKLSQSIGLHRDCARWKLSPGEVQKRRALFWELFITDCWQSLATGRLATFSLPFVDCELPFDPDQTLADDGSIQPSFPYWKARFGAECVAPVVQGTLTSRAPRYSIIIELDRKIRDMDLPAYAQGPLPQGLGLSQTMSHFMPGNYRCLTLLYIHRCFFAHAVSTSPLDPMKGQYAPSFLAGYVSAYTIVGSVRRQFDLFPAQIARFWVLWTHAFSASVMLASVATHASRSQMAPAALMELKQACDLFEDASRYGGRATKFLPILRRLQAKAQQAFRDANNGVPPKIPNDIFRPSQPNEVKDELSIFSGKTHTVSRKNTSSAAGTTEGHLAPSSTTAASRAPSDSPHQMFSDNPSFVGVHPSLVSELSSFHGHIKSRTQNAYRAGGEVFGGGPMVVDEQAAAPHAAPPLPQPVVLQQHTPPQSGEQYQYSAQDQEVQRQLYLQHQQEQLEREIWEREEAERRHVEEIEMQRQEEERREMMRQQELQQQLDIHREQARQQQEIQRRQAQQQLEIQQEQARQQHDLQRIQAQRQEEVRRQQEAQQELIRQQQQYDTRRLQEERQQEQYRQQQEQHRHLEYQRQQEQRAPIPSHQSQVSSGHYIQQQYEGGLQQAPYHGAVPTSAAPSSHQHHLSRHGSLRSQPEPHQVYQEPSPTHYQAPPSSANSLRHVSGATQHAITPQHTGVSVHATTPPHGVPPPRPRHSMYAIPPSEYPRQQPSPEDIQRQHQQQHQQQLAQVGHGYPASAGPYVHGQAHGESPPPPTPTSTSSEGYIHKYWPAAPNGTFAIPVDQPPPPPAPPQLYGSAQPPVPVQVQGTSTQGYEYYPQHYTPEGALRGIAADDLSLQETWQSYMNKVGSPRQFLED